MSLRLLAQPGIFKGMGRHSRCHFPWMQGQNHGFALFSFQLLGHVLPFISLLSTDHLSIGKLAYTQGLVQSGF